MSLRSNPKAPGIATHHSIAGTKYGLESGAPDFFASASWALDLRLVVGAKISKQKNARLPKNANLKLRLEPSGFFDSCM